MCDIYIGADRLFRSIAASTHRFGSQSGGAGKGVGAHVFEQINEIRIISAYPGTEPLMHWFNWVRGYQVLLNYF